MRTDDLYQVKYKCSKCRAELAIDDTNLARIADGFARLGWDNIPMPVGEKVEYIVTCPDCIERQLREEDAYSDACDVWDSQEMERQAARW